MITKLSFSHMQTDTATTVALSVLAFLTNTYLVGWLFGSTSLYAGGAIILLSLLILRIRYCAVVLFFGVLPIYLFGNELLFVLVQVMEFCFIALMLKKRMRFLLALSIFWFLIGLPIVAAYLYFSLLVNIQTVFFVAFTYVLFAYVAGLIGLMAYWLLPASYQRRGNNPKPPKFGRLVFELNTVSVILPVVVVTLFFVWHFATDKENMLADELNQAIQELNRSVMGLLDDKIHTLVSTVETLQSETNSDYYATILNTVANASANVESMVLVDKNANVLLAAPLKYAQMLPDLSDVNISHRKYFQETKRLRVPNVSRAIKGSGLGDLDIVALTAPIMQNNQFEGLLQAAIRLDKLVDESVVNAIQNDDILLLITDNESAIIYASPKLALTQLDAFIPKSEKHPFAGNQQTMKINEVSYLYQSVNNAKGWTVYTFIDPIRLFEGISTYLLFISLSLLLSMVFIGILSKGLAAKITTPLRNLDRFIADKTNVEKLLVESKITEEMESVAKKVVHSRKISEDFQRELSTQVEEKTLELKALNEVLLKQSQTDSLTGLYNRGAFDTLAANTYKYCQRHKKPFTLVLLDIDHFKSINDNYGHVAGDACIAKVAQLIGSKCRRDTDIVARYGGEEFVLLLASDNHENHQQYVTSIHNIIEQHILQFNDYRIAVTISGGVIKVVNDFSQDLISLISMADEQLYISKNNGRNQVTAIEI